MEIGLFSVSGAFYIQEKKTASNDSMEHLGLASIAAVLRQRGFSTTIKNILDDSEVIRYITSSKPFLVGFTTTCATIQVILKLVKKCREINPNIYIVCGGHLATFAPDRLLDACSEIDFLIRGEGEFAFAELCELIRDCKSYEQCENLSFRKNNKNIHNPNRDLIQNLDILPYPVREKKRNVASSISYRISGSRGCFGNCSFCSGFVGRGQKPIWRGRSISNIVDEIEYLVTNYGANTFEFVDASFEDPPNRKRERLLEFAREIEKRKLRIYFNCNFRADNWKLEDQEVIEALERVGLERVFVGIEAGTSSDLRLFQKRASVADNFNVLELFNNRKLINVTFGYIMFHPYATFESLEASAHFLYRTGISYDIRNYLTRLEVYPGTKMHEMMKEDGLVVEKSDFSEFYDYNFLHADVENFCNSMHWLLQVKEIFEYIDCDMRVSSYLSRLYRDKLYENKDNYSDVDLLYQEFLETRSSMVKYNYNFFMGLLSEYRKKGYVDINLNAERMRIFLKKTIKELRMKQLKQMKMRRKHSE